MKEREGGKGIPDEDATVTICALALLVRLGGGHLELLANMVPGVDRGLLERVASLLEGGSTPLRMSDADWRAFARGCALADIEAKPDPMVLAGRASSFSWALPSVHQEWYDACASRIRGLGEGACAAWRDALSKTPFLSEPGEQDGKLQPPEARSVTVQPIEAPWELPYLFDVWHERPVCLRLLDEFPPFHVLQALVPDWWTIVAGWTDPRFVQGAFFCGDFRESPLRATEVLRCAPACFDDEGQPTGFSAAVVVCESALTGVKARLQAGVGSDQTKTEVRDFAAALVDRADGPFVAAAFGAWLVSEAYLHPGPDRYLVKAARLLVDAVSDRLAMRYDPITRLRGDAERRSVLARGGLRPRVAELPSMILAILSVGSADQTQRSACRDWVLDVLRREEEWEHLEAVEPIACALVKWLETEQHPMEAARALFEALEPQRIRDEYSASRHRFYGTSPSVVVLLAMTYLVDRLRPADAFAQLRFIEERAARLWLTVRQESSALEPACLVAVIVATAANVWGVVAPQAAALAERYGGDTAVAAGLVVCLQAWGPELRNLLLATWGRGFRDLVEEISRAALAHEPYGKLRDALQLLQTSEEKVQPDRLG